MSSKKKSEAFADHGCNKSAIHTEIQSLKSDLRWHQTELGPLGRRSGGVQVPSRMARKAAKGPPAPDAQLASHDGNRLR
jgi:hypothetical protein